MLSHISHELCHPDRRGVDGGHQAFKQFAVLLREVPSGNLESDRARWAALLDVLDEGRPEQLVHAVIHLADLGIDRSSRLDTLVRTSMIAPDVQALAQATAAAVRTRPKRSASRAHARVEPAP